MGFFFKYMIAEDIDMLSEKKALRVKVDAYISAIVPLAKVVFHLFKKLLFSGSIENAIAFNTFSILRLARK